MARILIYDSEDVGEINLYLGDEECFVRFLTSFYPEEDFQECYRKALPEEESTYDAQIVMNSQFFDSVYDIVTDVQEIFDEMFEARFITNENAEIVAFTFLKS